MATLVQQDKKKQFNTIEMAKAGFNAFINITNKWGLKRQEQIILLGGVSESTFYKWLKEGSPNLDRNHLERISCILGIHKNLRILLKGESVYNWVRRPIGNDLFMGKSALEIMLNGGFIDIYKVRRYLDGYRGW
ncbi:MAG: DUF2384 domain-containing protein [Denitrovibrio sp.]|nr:MAG: DUF2384 domain-containing protein [Denitrovibrio sp.]